MGEGHDQDREQNLFYACLDLPPARWAEYLEQACGADVQLKARTARLLAAHAQAEQETLSPPLHALIAEDLTDRLGPYRLDLLEDDGKWIVERRHEHPAHDVDHRYALPGSRLPEPGTTPGHAGGEVCRAEQLRLPRNVFEDLFLVPDMIAGRHHVYAKAQDRLGDVAGDAKAGGRVLDVRNHEIQVVFLNQGRDGPLRDVATWLSEDVADEEDAHSGGLDRNDDLCAAAFIESRQHDAKFAGNQRRLRSSGIDGA